MRLWVGFSVVVGLILIAGLFLAGSPKAPPEAVRPPEPASPVLPVPVAESAPKPPVVPPPAPAPVPRAAKPENLAPVLAQLDLKLADLDRQERFREALDLLSLSRPEHDSLEWTAAIQHRVHDLEAKVKELRSALLVKMNAARAAGKEADAKSIADRIDRWGVPEPEPAAAPVPEPAAPTPAPGAPAPPPPAATPVPPPVVAAPPKSALIPFAAGLAKWSLLTPSEMSATGGATLTRLEDGSILASGTNPAKVRYTLRVPTEIRGITALRLETLVDATLPGQGPGRTDTGNFVLSEFQIQVLPEAHAAAGSPVPIERSMADFAQDGFPIHLVYDGKDDTGWAVYPQAGRAHEAIFELKAPIGGSGPVTLLLVLDHQAQWPGHNIGRFRLSASTSKSPTQELANRPLPPVDPARVRDAIQRALAWLRNPPYPAGYDWNPNELILWTFVVAGVPENDPEFQRRLKGMLDGPLDRTYRVALQAMILEELDRVAYQPRLWQCAQYLIDTQCPNGQWSYGTPMEFSKGAIPPSKTAPAVAKLDAEGRRLKPKVARKLVARKSRDGPPEGDNSLSQFAALGLRACFDAGIVIPEETVLRAIKAWVDCQYFDEHKEGDAPARGWSYTSAAKVARATSSMTAGGVYSLTIYEYMLGRDWKRNVSLKHGATWLGQLFTPGDYYYALCGLERAGALYGAEKFGRQSWYLMWAPAVLDRQDPSGGWLTHGPRGAEPPDDLAWDLYDTCFAVLFLKKATRPLVGPDDPRGR